MLTAVLLLGAAGCDSGTSEPDRATDAAPDVRVIDWQRVPVTPAAEPARGRTDEGHAALPDLRDLPLGDYIQASVEHGSARQRRDGSATNQHPQECLGA